MIVDEYMELPTKLLHPDAKLPMFAHTSDAGMDLCTVDELTLYPGAWGQVHTGIALGIPEGYVGLVWDKSGLSQKAGLKTLGGVIDAGYHGEIVIGILNTSDVPYTFIKGQKVAQILIQKVEHPTVVSVDMLEDSERGEAGFGSTGI